jgi:beta-barrel assembly-enhancing protease
VHARGRLRAGLLLVVAMLPAWAGAQSDLFKDRLRDLLQRSLPAQAAPAPAAPVLPVAPVAPVAPVVPAGAAASTAPTEAGPEIRIPPVGRVPVEDEVRLGRRVSGSLLGAAPLVPDDDVQAYVNLVGRWIAQHSDRPELKWTFAVIESRDINAFAAPGGYIFVTRGLYERLRNESELAGVLAHEIAHVQEKHHLKVLQKSQAVDLGARLLRQRTADAGAAVQRLIGSGAEMLARGLDKEAEFEADRVGVVLAARAGYDPWGLVTVLQDMASFNAQDSAVGMLFKTHPHPDERLLRLAESIGDRFDGLQGPPDALDRFVRLTR